MSSNLRGLNGDVDWQKTKQKAKWNKIKLGGKGLLSGWQWPNAMT